MHTYRVSIVLMTGIRAGSKKEARCIAEDIGGALKTMTEYAKDVDFIEARYEEYGETEEE